MIENWYYILAGTLTAAAKKINVNTATKAELMTLPGIGEVLAEHIIAGRPYAKVEDLLQVKGIGSKTLEKIRDQRYGITDTSHMGHNATLRS